MRTILAIAAAGLGLAAIAAGAPAQADVTVLGNGLAAGCSTWAREAARIGAASAQAIDECTLAIDNEVLGRHELAATYVNRGVLHLARSEYVPAKRDFDTASTIEPDLGEAYVNRGAALIGLGKASQGVAEISKGLALDPSEPEKAYFNRALGEERLGDLKAAYDDYMMAQELKPDWDQPRTELARFHVERR